MIGTPLLIPFLCSMTPPFYLSKLGGTYNTYKPTTETLATGWIVDSNTINDIEISANNIATFEGHYKIVEDSFEVGIRAWQEPLTIDMVGADDTGKSIALLGEDGVYH